MKKRRTTVLAFLLVAAIFLGVGYANVTDNLFIFGSGSSQINGGSGTVENKFQQNIKFQSVAGEGGDEVTDKAGATVAVVGDFGHEANFANRISAIPASPTYTAAASSDLAGQDDVATITVTGFTAINDFATVPCVIVNKNADLDAVLVPKFIDSNGNKATEIRNDHYLVTYAWENATTDVVDDEENDYYGMPIIKANNGTRTLNVTIKMTQTPTSTDSNTATTSEVSFTIVIDAVAHNQ